MNDANHFREQFQNLEMKHQQLEQIQKQNDLKSVESNEKLAVLEVTYSNAMQELNTLKDQLLKEREAHQHHFEHLKSQIQIERMEFKQKIADLLRENTESQESCKQWEEALEKHQKLYLEKVNQLKLKIRDQKKESENIK